MMTTLAPGQLTPPLMEDLQYTAYISPDTPLLTTLTYMDGRENTTTLTQCCHAYYNGLYGFYGKPIQDEVIVSQLFF